MTSFPRRIALLGSTGSIGQQTLDVVRCFPEHFQIVALAARSNVELLAQQAQEFHPKFVACFADTPHTAKAARAAIPGVLLGEDGLLAVATHSDVDIVVAATSGLKGLQPTLAAIRAGKTIALSNKETLVMAGHLVMQAAREQNVSILPVDSEHSAIWQCLRGEDPREVRRLILTASGGPFRSKPLSAMAEATVEEAMRHPTWNMGAKITIDSATLMNKGLEVIEARWLFGFGADEIDIVVHPESVVHSMIELVDGSVIAQMGVTDMRHAIQYALTYPERHACAALPPLDLMKLATLHFEAPDTERFPCIPLAYRALREGGTLPAALNAANEEAVKAFLAGRIRLTDIPRVIENVMDAHETRAVASLDVVLDVDREARARAAHEIARVAEVSKVVA